MDVFLPYGVSFCPLAQSLQHTARFRHSGAPLPVKAFLPYEGRLLLFGANKACGMLPGASISEYLCPWRCFTLREKIQKLFGVYFGGTER